ncbi:hypothetical protein [Ornithinibacillus halotolerans]|uniref:Uncharacterized protein n=1 Tax=Ornithinibacillus halotolerans TaxID=1274357 RepID=A0A916RUJ7_9BACI|nr:hypothetical protein [Ornithinibacillus halotolerans]GGA71754.1 hypothetical protein GCM10008025_14530 [Ornithinibacillus halotolerans]
MKKDKKHNQKELKQENKKANDATLQDGFRYDYNDSSEFQNKK